MRMSEPCYRWLECRKRSVEGCVRIVSCLGGIRCWVHRDRLSLPLHRVENQSRRWGAYFTRASRGEELHLYNLQVIKDLFGLSPSSLALRHFEGTDHSMAR